MANETNRIIYGAIGLVLLFVLMSTLVLPTISKTMGNTCQSISWYGADGGSYANCTNRVQSEYNTTSTPTDYPITETSPDDHLWATNLCLQCNDVGGYSSTVKGLFTLVVVIALISSAVYLMRR